MGEATAESLDAVGFVVQRYQAAVDDNDRETARILGVNRTDMRCLELLLGADGLSPRALGERLGLTTGSVTAMLDRLERLGFLVRTPHGEDRRKTIVRMTDAGAARCYELVAPLIADGKQALAARFDADQIEIAMRFLDTLIEVQSRHVERLIAQRHSRSGPQSSHR
jgi:DNA-binding MarR family transcriptional regulator